jgi:hypothetical protein
MIGNPKLAKEVSSKDSKQITQYINKYLIELIDIFPKHDIRKEALNSHLKRLLGLSQVLGSVGDVISLL